MYLKKIHIQGFKSFADKIEIKFKNNITAIVGPNGSGKSNISDAVRWVLGEQSIKSLRGSKMEDIIFAGTNKRPALSFAEVTIFFDNKDGEIPLEYNEVAVTRRIFRSGDSEYYINKNSCRLKDIRSLFMDTGIGKDGYSIIGQGRIDEILSNKPEDRRSIFEEAAGIIKYKTKKEESERKLKNTDENLLRIDDLIAEIGSQSKRLEKDSKKANEFISTFNELKDLESNIYIKDINKVDDQKTLIKRDIFQMENEIIGNENEKQEKESKFESLKIEMDSKEREIEILREKKENIIRLKEEFNNSLNLSLEKESFYKKDLERINKELKEINHEKNRLDKETKSEVEKEKLISKDYKDLISEYEIKQKELNIIDGKINRIEMEIEDKKHKINFLYEEIADKKGKINNVNDIYLNIDNRLSEFENEKRELLEKLNTIARDIKKLLNDKRQIEIKQNEFFEEKSRDEFKEKELQRKVNTDLKKIKELEIKVERINSSYKLYKNMEYSYEGYYKSVKNLIKALENKKLKNNGFHGIIGSLLSVDEKYEVAINISLGGNLQNIVVDSEENAKYMISYLKNNNLGRVTFLPINTIKGSSLNINIEEIKKYGVIGIANELIEYEKKYENIFKSLLGRTIVIDSIDNAILFAKETNHKYRIVSLAGEILNPGGSLSGGSYNDNISIINRRNKIKNMESSLDSLKFDLNNLRDENLIFQDDLNLLKNKIEMARVNLEESNIDKINIDNDIKSLENKKDFFKKNIQKLGYQIEEVQNSSRESLENSLQDKEVLKTDLNKLAKLKEVVKENMESLNSNKENREKVYKHVNEIELSIKLTESELSNLNNEIKKLKEKILDNNLLKEKRIEELSLNKEELEEIIISKESSNCEKEKRSLEELEINKEIKIKSLNKDKYINDFYREQETLKTLNRNINTLERARNEKELKLSKLQIKRDNISLKLMEDYNLTVEAALLIETPLDDIKKSRNRVGNLKSKIKQIGSVNLGSLEEYKEVKERLDFMEAQHKDLIKSKESLQRIIKDMEKEMRVHFLSSFKEIKENFSEVFSELFDGGTATLELENNEEDILTSGIEIKAKPPGKVLQNLSLLSGGEKSLVAVSLLFAILKAKPSPFCILDEIDAALDDSNINRYTSYLKKINKYTQVVLITHRKTSMEIANVLYGVTMEEKGISRIISMKLKENVNELVG